MTTSSPTWSRDESSPERAQALIARHRWDLAERELNAVLASDPHDPMALALVGRRLFEARGVML